MNFRATIYQSVMPHNKVLQNTALNQQLFYMYSIVQVDNLVRTVGCFSDFSWMSPFCNSSLWVRQGSFSFGGWLTVQGQSTPLPGVSFFNMLSEAYSLGGSHILLVKTSPMLSSNSRVGKSSPPIEWKELKILHKRYG